MKEVNYTYQIPEPAINHLIVSGITIKGQPQYSFVWLYVFFKKNGLTPLLYDVSGREINVIEETRVQYSVRY